MSVEQRIPKSLVGPLGIVSLVVGLAGIVLGYIFTVIGITLFFGLNGLQGVTRVDAVIVIASGIVCVGIAYLGYKGFMRYAA